MMTVNHITVGPIQTNCYLAGLKESNEVLIIDPGDEADRIGELLARLGKKPTAILLTHGHFDHIGAVEALRALYGIPVYALREEKSVMEAPKLNLCAMVGMQISLKADCELTDGQVLPFFDGMIQVIATPGHTKGSCCYYIPSEKILFSGDTLFYESCGRTDFPTGSSREIVSSIRERLFCLPDDVIVYPGHGEMTSIGWEKENNRFV